jgi:hypothetical protein
VGTNQIPVVPETVVVAVRVSDALSDEDGWGVV